MCGIGNAEPEAGNLKPSNRRQELRGLAAVSFWHAIGEKR